MQYFASLTWAALASCAAWGCSENGGAGGAPASTGAGGGSGAVVGAGSGGTTGAGSGGVGPGSGGAGTGGGGPVGDTCAGVPAAARVDAWTAGAHFCLIRFASGVPSARQIAFAPNGDLFVASGNDNGRITVLFDADGDGTSGADERSTFATLAGGNHSVVLTATHVYASSPTIVVRWAYASGQRTATGTPETVVRGIPGGGHASRTLLIDGQNRLYVNIGSAGNTESASRPEHTSLAARVDPPVRSRPDSGGRLRRRGRRAFRVGAAQRSRSRLRRSRPHSGRREWARRTPRAAVTSPSTTRPIGLPLRSWSARPRLRLPVLLERGGLDGWRREGSWGEPRQSQSTGSVHRGQVPRPEPGRLPAFPMRAHLAPLDIVEYVGHGVPRGVSRKPVRHGARFVEPRRGTWARGAHRHSPSHRCQRLADPGRQLLRQAEQVQEGQWPVRPSTTIRIDPVRL